MACHKIQIEEIVAHIFENELYCEDVLSAKERVTAAFQSEYEKLTAEHSEIQAAGILMSRYGTIEDAAKFAGYTSEQIENWRTDRHVSTKKEIAHAFRKVRGGIYIGSVFTVFTLVALINLFLHPNLFWSVQTAVYTVIAVLCGVFICQKRNLFQYESVCLDAKAEKYVRKQSDQYYKRMINSFGVAVAGLFCLIYLFIVAILKLAKNLGEVFSSL